MRFYDMLNLTPKNLNLTSAADVDKQAYPLSNIIAKLNEKKCRVKVLLLDACRTSLTEKSKKIIGLKIITAGPQIPIPLLNPSKRRIGELALSQSDGGTANRPKTRPRKNPSTTSALEKLVFDGQSHDWALRVLKRGNPNILNLNIIEKF